MCHPLSASIVLLAVVCKEPTHPEAYGDLSLLAWFVRFLERMVRDGGYDLWRMRDGVCKLEKLGADAVSTALGSTMHVNPALWPLRLPSDYDGTVRKPEC